jgi:hypothetical protein
LKELSAGDSLFGHGMTLLYLGLIFVRTPKGGVSQKDEHVNFAGKPVGILDLG